MPNNRNDQHTYGTYGSIPEQEREGFPLSQPKRRSNLPWILGAVALIGPLFYLFVFLLPEMQGESISVPDLIKVSSLDVERTPEFSDNSRLIIIGDVHGMMGPLKRLLKETDYEENRDHLVFLGDFISKGERSMEVLDFVMRVNASCVRGNHEDEILDMYADYYNVPRPRKYKQTVQAIPSDARPIDEHIAKNLTPPQVRFISQCPTILRLGNVTERGIEAVAVHAGLEWQKPHLEDMDPIAVMTMRTLLPPDYIEPTEGKDGMPWIKRYNQHMEDLPKDQRRVVYYGHAASAGLQLKEYTNGIDTRCIKGDQLTAIVISKTKKGKYQQEAYAVDC